MLELAVTRYYCVRMRTSDEGVADAIVRLSNKGTISTPFRVQDFRDHFPDTSEHHLNTILPNYEVKGYMVIKRGRPPRFKRVARGLYKPL